MTEEDSNETARLMGKLCEDIYILGYKRACADIATEQGSNATTMRKDIYHYLEVQRRIEDNAV